jgi:phage shock protein PspC (stress-responsive transcriptional regulator)
VGKYFPGKMMSVVGYTGLARTFGIPVTISSLGVVVIAVFGVMSVSLVGLISLLGYPRVFPELSRTGAGIFSFLIIFFLLLFFPAVYWRIINFCFRLLRQPTVKPDLNSGPALKMLGRVLLQNFLYFLGTALITSGIVEIPKSVFFVLVGILCIANLTGFLAFFTPAGIGVREGIILVMLTPIMGSGIAGVVAIVVRLIQTIVDVILFISALFFYRGPKNPGD